MQAQFPQQVHPEDDDRCAVGCFFLRPDGWRVAKPGLMALPLSGAAV